MICKVLLAVFCCCCLFKVQGAERSPRIIIVGCGAAGIAAASRLLEYGFNNVTILEAEDRIGGRVFTKQWGDYWVDLGGQWVHGEVDNAAYELAWPLGLLEHSAPSYRAKFYSSSGPTITEDTGNELVEYFMNITAEGVPDDWINRSIGEFYEQKLDEWFDGHPEITEDLRKSLRRMSDLLEMSDFAGNSWFDVTKDNEVTGSEGDQALNWKDKGYGMILDILMKKYPDPAEELPVLNNTILNTEVSQIHYDVENGSIRVVTANGHLYHADHVIVTTSVGVLKAEYRTMFSPPLPKAKVNAIEGIELGHVAKIYLLYSEPWWIEPNSEVSPNYFFNFHWTDEDRYEYANDPNRAWMLSIVTATIVEHKSRLLCCWLTGPFARKMETFSANRVFEQVKQFFHRFLGRTHNISEPVAMLRSTWYINKHFRGTWSYHSLRTARSGAKAIDLERPIMTTNGEPLVQFAGEATHSIQPSTVHGAIDSGWREARRLTQLYAGRRFLPTHAGTKFWTNFDEADPVLSNRLVTGSWHSVVAKRRKSNKN